MTTMNSEVYDALRDAQGVSDEKARKAAESVAAFDKRFAKIQTDLTLLKWMAGMNAALAVAILARLLIT